MRNRYPGICYRCGQTVEANAGHFERIPGGWRTQHASCAITYRGTDQHFMRLPTPPAGDPTP